MSKDSKRLIVFFVLSAALFWLMPIGLRSLGLLPPVRPQPIAKKAPLAKSTPKAETKAEGKPATGKDSEKTEKTVEAAKSSPPPTTPTTTPPAVRSAPTVPLAAPSELVLGSADPKSGYRLEVQLTQYGAGVESIVAADFESEILEGRPRGRRLVLARPNLVVPIEIRAPSQASTARVGTLANWLVPVGSSVNYGDPIAELTIDGATVAVTAPSTGIVTRQEVTAGKPVTPGQTLGALDGPPPSLALALSKDLKSSPEESNPSAPIPALGALAWEVVRDEQGRAAREVQAVDPATKQASTAQEIAFKTQVAALDLTVIKRFRLWKGRDAFEVELLFDSPNKDQVVGYELLGPHGLTIEGEWYASTFRDFHYLGVGGKIQTVTAYEIDQAATATNSRKYAQTTPLIYAGVENQYFNMTMGPTTPSSSESRWDAEVLPIVIDHNIKDIQKTDIGLKIRSQPISVGPNRSATHAYWVFAGPKRNGELTPYGATDLASYRKGLWWFPTFGASTLAMYVIAPMLVTIYEGTSTISALFGGTRGYFGLAIILLTVTVRLLLFPLSRKQAIMAKKMQDLQPVMNEVKLKYEKRKGADGQMNQQDKEAMTREMFSIYGKYKVNPLSGCLPALIQLPILMGLWQALNNCVDLRNAPFLYIHNLAAPDMLFRFPIELPFLGQYFNLLPLVSVGLMLWQMKMYSPPATTPEQEMQQKMMKWMMLMMAVMFYKLPSGMGVYLITSSTWSIGERKLINRLVGKTVPVTEAEAKSGGDGPAKSGPQGWLRNKLKALLDEAQHSQTVRNVQERGLVNGQSDREPNRARDTERPRDGERPRDRGKKRSGSGPGRGR